MNALLPYLIAAVALIALGLRALLLHRDTLRRLLAINVLGAGVFMILIAAARRADGLPPDPVPHALVLTGIVVAVAATALGLALDRAVNSAATDDDRRPDAGNRGDDNPGDAGRDHAS
ncbi:MAG: cation:proton antiporter subunit C [Gammaproteobacteria bacterium]|nr:cation:proton antiporter subunit C [Gammaproteobacteria bacterium]